MVLRMKTRRSIISKKTKTQIMAEANIPGNVVSEVAAKYKIPPYLLYAWRSKTKRRNSEQITKKLENPQTQPIFVEALLNESVVKPLKHTQLLLKKLSLEFEDFSLGIEGKFSSKQLIQLITILEQSC